MRRGIAIGVVVTALVLTGCSQGSGSTREDRFGDGWSTGQVPLPSPSYTSSPGAVVAPIHKAVGETFSVESASGTLAQFSVTAITLDVACEVSDAHGRPTDGRLVRIDLDGAATAALRQPLAFGENAWSALPEGGGAANRHVWASADCLPDTEQFPAVVRGETNVAGSVVLEVPDAHGTLVLQVAPGLRWSWTY
ncbi:hypothetical protein AB0E56_16280 [Microbacterium sp. NPDC028030]|uniref:hypothetical protein n=1 Tax=Microbacterium sp. NPDC028030 TaxID=3155124 RepID=UPI0033D3F72B